MDNELQQTTVQMQPKSFFSGQASHLISNLTKHAFHLLKINLKAEKPTNKQQLKVAAEQAGRASQGRFSGVQGFLTSGSHYNHIIFAQVFKMIIFIFQIVLVQSHLSLWKCVIMQNAKTFQTINAMCLLNPL